jgi:hypothetical protein
VGRDLQEDKAGTETAWLKEGKKDCSRRSPSRESGVRTLGRRSACQQARGQTRAAHVKGVLVGAVVVPSLPRALARLMAARAGAAQAPGARRSVLAFVALTVAQIAAFLWAPWLYADAAPELNAAPASAFFRLIGLFEVGLMAVYTASVYYDDRAFYWLTVAGRFTTIPYAAVVVLVLGGPRSVVLGIVQDIAFASWTLGELLRAGSRPWAPGGPPRSLRRRVAGSGAPLAELPVRIALAAAGLRLSILGLELFSDPTSAHAFLNYTPDMAPVFLGARSVGFMLTLVGLYELACALHRAPLGTYVAFGFLHLVSMDLLPRNAGAIVGSAELANALHPPPTFHAPAGLAILALSILLWSLSSPFQAAKEKE